MKSDYKTLGDYIEKVDIRNKGLKTQNLKGISMTKEFRASTSNIVGTDLSKYKIVADGVFACDFMSVIRVNKYPVVHNKTGEDIIVSPAYTVFQVSDTQVLLPEYLMLWFRREEFDRYAFFKCDSAVRGGFGWNELCSASLPVPPIEKQKAIVKAYQVVTDRIALKEKINGKLEEMAECTFNNSFEEADSSIWERISLVDSAIIKTGKLNSEDAVLDGSYPFFTCSQETYKTNTFAFEQEAVILAGNNASAIYPLKIFEGKFDAYQRTYVISSIVEQISNKQLYFTLKNQLERFKGISSGTTTKFLTMKILAEITVLIPPNHVARGFKKITNSIFEEIRNNEGEILKLKSLQSLLLSRLATT